VRVGTEGHRPPESDGRIPPRSRGGGGQHIESSPAVVGGTVYIGSGDGNVYALDPADGSERWSYDTGGEEPVYDDVISSPAVVNGTVYVGTIEAWNNGSVLALTGTTADDAADEGGSAAMNLSIPTETASPGETTTIEFDVTNTAGTTLHGVSVNVTDLSTGWTVASQSSDGGT
jgi:hypothetical protein